MPDFEQLRFEAFLSAIGRARWFILATILISSLIVFDAYLGLWGVEEFFLKGAIRNRIEQKSEAFLHCFQVYIANGTYSSIGGEDCRQLLNEKLGPEFGEIPQNRDSRLLSLYAEIQYAYLATQHSLDSLKRPERGIPFLGVTVSTSDYLPLMGVILTVFTIGIWFCARSVEASLRVLLQGQNVEQLRTLAQVSFTFTSLPDNSNVARAVRHLAFCCAPLALFFGFMAELYVVLKSYPPGFFVVSVIIREFTIVGLLIIQGITAYFSIVAARRCDGLVAPPRGGTP